ncbi:Zn-dependent hydrolase [Virgibacillus kekensis]|uniref:Zn-dependent hydrolase n=1 Tax=Virgibacillus kekensis TaxID=202261 RepID=A0ABV9DDN4_9BACI
MQKFSLKDKLMNDYTEQDESKDISGERLASRLDDLSKIGLTPGNGSNRPGFSKEEKHAKELVGGWMRNAGLNVREDGAGNIIGRLEGKNNQLPAIMCGSHVDSVPNGGHFDGPVGVLSALEVVEAWNQTGFRPEKPFEVVVFSDEEGARFNGGFNGSEAITGKGDINEKRLLKDKDGLSFEKVLNEVGLDIEGYQESRRNPNEIEMFIEVHIEQGKRLEKENLPCGIVTGIAGPCWIEFSFTGEAGHAGNTPMNDRKDALVAASEFILEANKLPGNISESAVATVGRQMVEPNGVNVIPGKVTLFADIRDIHKETRDQLAGEILTLAHNVAKKHGVEIEHQEKIRIAPVPIREEIQDNLEKAFQEEGIRPYRLPSGAGHDAMVIGEIIPVAMLFVRSKDGISHNPEEWSDLADCVQTIKVLKNFIEQMQ